jgi:hypothetical protein
MKIGFSYKLVRFVLILALTTQISHAAWVFDAISKDSGSLISEIMSYVFAVSLESSIYIFTVAGKKRTATFFGVISTLLNVLYYWFSVGLTFQFFAMMIISPIIPITIWYYAELINDRKFKTMTKDK